MRARRPRGRAAPARRRVRERRHAQARRTPTRALRRRRRSGKSRFAPRVGRLRDHAPPWIKSTPLDGLDDDVEQERRAGSARSSSPRNEHIATRARDERRREAGAPLRVSTRAAPWRATTHGARSPRRRTPSGIIVFGYAIRKMPLCADLIITRQPTARRRATTRRAARPSSPSPRRSARAMTRSWAVTAVTRLTTTSTTFALASSQYASSVSSGELGSPPRRSRRDCSFTRFSTCAKRAVNLSIVRRSAPSASTSM